MFKIEDCTLPLLQIIIWFLACKNLNKAAYLWFCYRHFFIQLISYCCFNSLFKYFKEVHKAFPVYWRAKSLIDFIDSWWQILHFSGVAVRKAWGLNLSGGGGGGGGGGVGGGSCCDLHSNYANIISNRLHIEYYQLTSADIVISQIE